MSGPDIFISYSREERSAARHFAESFTREGFSVWWDAVLRSGQTFDEVIERELRAAKSVVVLWSPRSVVSRWVRAEATLADRSNKLVPAIIEKCNLPIIFELTQAADLSSWNGDTSDPRWRDLVSDLRRLVGHDEPEEAPSVPAARSPAPVQPAAPKTDELMAALARIGTPRVDLSKPTEQEEQHTQFYRRSDEQRKAEVKVESEQFHVLERLGDQPGASRFVVNSAGLTIGRAAPADVIVAGQGVSRSHCQVDFASGGQVQVTDLNSTNGTFVDGERIEGSVPLPVGSVLRIGNVSFKHGVGSRTAEPGPVDLADFGAGLAPDFNRIARS